MLSSQSRLSPRALRMAILVILSPVIGCSDGGRTSADVLGIEPYALKGQFLELTPDVASLTNIGERITLSASVRDARGKVIPGARVDYRTMDQSIAMVDASGTVTGLSEGVASVVGTSGSATDTVVIAVAARKLGGGGASVAVYPSMDTITSIGLTVQLQGVARNNAGRLLSNANLQWVSVNPDLAAVSSSGLVTGVASGIARIVASLDSAADTATVWVAVPGLPVRVVVSPKGDTILATGGQAKLAAVVLDGLGSVLQKAVAWTSLDATIASVDASGMTTGKAKGIARIVAAHGSLADTARVWVAPTLTPARIDVQPATDTIPTVGGTKQLTATVLDAIGNTVLGAIVSWGTLDPAVVTVSNTGKVTGATRGVARVTARINTLVDTAIIHVSPAMVVAAVQITPNGGKIGGTGQTLQVQASAVDASGAQVTNATVAWKSLDATIITVTASGNGQQATLKGLKLGETAVVAASGGVADTAWFRVAVDTGGAGTPTRVDITPAVDTIPTVGGSLQLSARVVDQSGNTLTGLAVKWASLDGVIASVDSTGRVKSLKQGLARVTAQHLTLKDTAWIYVAPSTTGATATSVSITPASTTIYGIGQTVTLAAVVLDQFGKPMPSLAPTWSSLDPTVATVNISGDVKSVAAGTARITAVHGSLADTAQVTVSASAAKLTLSVAHSPNYPAANTNVTFTAAATPSGAVAATSLTVNGTVVRTCTTATCSWTSQFGAGTHTYSATATDTAGTTVAAGPRSFTIWPAPSGGSYSPTSPHWSHMRVGATDYRIHYKNLAPNQDAEWDWAAGHVDQVVGGSVDEYKQRNPTMRQVIYDLLWAPRQVDTPAMDQWLQANGYAVENAYLHKSGTSRSPANRLTTTIWNSARFLTNPGDPGFQAYRRSRTGNLTAMRQSGFQYDGLFIDELGTGVIQYSLPGITLEYGSLGAYYTDFRSVLSDMRQKASNGLIILNTAQYRTTEDLAQVATAGASMTEFLNSPYAEAEPGWRDVEKMMSSGAVVQFATGVSSNTKGKVRFDMNAGNYGSIAERVLLWEYASYLMIVDPARMDQLLFDTYGLDWTVPMSTTWLTAFETDIGRALAGRSAFKQGTDAVGQVYTVWSRDFENALVLIRPMKNWAHTRYGDPTAIDVTLPSGTWRLLLPDGSVSGPVSTVSLRNAEAVILLK